MGQNENGFELRNLISKGYLQGYEFMGIIQDEVDSPGESNHADIIGNLARMGHLLEKLEIHEVIIAKNDDSYNLAVKIMSENRNRKVPVKILTGKPTPRSIVLIEVNFTERSHFKGK